MSISVSLNQTPVDPVKNKESRRLARSLTRGGIVIVLLLFGLLLRVLAFEGALITSGSMEDTLKVGDYLLVNHRVALRGSWQRGDIVIFDPPEVWDAKGETLVKRVIGLPGETIQLYNGEVYINRKPLNESYLKERPDPFDTLPYTLGQDEYFVLGDNRNNSDDSRENGPIRESDIRGKAVFTLWPVSHLGSIASPSYTIDSLANGATSISWRRNGR